MSRLTEGHLVRHYQGAKGGRDAALLDIAQDHALFRLHERGLFDDGLVFKGGTALRKFRAGNSGRFSTDLDFAAPDSSLALAVLEALDGVDVNGFTFNVTNIGDDGRRTDLAIGTRFGTPRLGAKVELARHGLCLEPDFLAPVALPIHYHYDFELPVLPVIRVEEAIAEKLARLRRVPLARDLYDLQWYASAGAFDDALVRRLWVLKVYRDIVVDGRGTAPIDPADITGNWTATQFHPEDIGYLTRPVNLDEWLNTIHTRFAFLADLTADERRWAEGNGRHLREVTAALAPQYPKPQEANPNPDT